MLLLLLLLIVGCAQRMAVVPDSDWRTVPAAQRAELDQQCDADLATARAEHTTAAAGLAALQRTPPEPPRAAPPRSPAPADPNDPLAIADREREQARFEAFARVEQAAAEVRRTDLAWRRLRVEAAQTRIAVVESQRELLRAQAIDRNLPGADHYDVAPLRGQFSRAQKRWYTIASRAGAARDAFERATTALASAKEAYAQLMRGGPIHPPEPAVAADHAKYIELPGWTITRSDLLLHRRGLRRLLAATSETPPRLRTMVFQLSPALRTAPAARPSPAAAPPPPGHPAQRAGHPRPPAAASARKSAVAPPRGAASVPATVEHPADRAGRPSPPAAASARKPAVGPPRSAAPPASGRSAGQPSPPATTLPDNASQASESP